MKNLLLALGILAASSIGALAAEPAKMVDSSAGKVLATPEGMALYTYDKDTNGKSVCADECLVKWPAFSAEAGAKSEGDFTVVKSADGKDMWAYKGKPLYTYYNDKKAGDVEGDGKGGVWHLVK
ncbi:hypothetical protein HBA94_08040 [Ochrobactrum sp. GRS2]|nr:hypothetical protein [Ochrobactrum sp. GRS2]